MIMMKMMVPQIATLIEEESKAGILQGAVKDPLQEDNLAEVGQDVVRIEKLDRENEK